MNKLLESTEIVLIDDELEHSDSVEEILSSEFPFIYKKFNDPREALTYITSNNKKILAVLSDFQMPDLNGFEIRQEMLDHKLVDIPFFVITGFYDKAMAKKAMSIKINDFIEKPINTDSLIDSIKEGTAERLETMTDDAEMKLSFLEESQPMIKEIEGLILELEENPTPDTLNTYFRLLHTVKGTAACVGFQVLSEFAHKYENFVNKIRDKKIVVNGQSITALLKGCDILKVFFEELSECRDYSLSNKEIEQMFDMGSDRSPQKEIVADTSRDKANETKKTTKEQSINVPIAALDEFMELSGTLTVLRSSVIKLVDSVQKRHSEDQDIYLLGKYLEEMHITSGFLQKRISEMRKVPLKKVFRPYRRVIRDIAEYQNKEIDLITKGEDLSIDMNLASAVENCLIHLVRNSADHGIENKIERQEKGKIEKGTINLSAYIKQDVINIEIQDDGKGLDKDAIREKANSNGLYPEEELNNFSDEQIYDLIFHAGLSTAQKVTDLSGRGVGLDMVKSTITDLNGSIKISTKKNISTKFHVKIPVPKSVHITDALLVTCNKKLFAIDQSEIQEVIIIKDEQINERINDVNGVAFINHFGATLPVVDLADILDYEGPSEKTGYNIIIVNSDNGRFGLSVEQILDVEEVAIKQMDPKLNQRELFRGSSLADGGKICLLLSAKGISKGITSEGTLNNNAVSSPSQLSVVASNEDSLILFELGVPGLFAVPVFDVYRFESIDLKDVVTVGETPTIKYRGSVMSLVDVSGVLRPQKSPKSSTGISKLIVVEREGEFYGLMIKEIADIAFPESQIDTNNITHKIILGTVFVGERTVTLLNVQKLIELTPTRLYQLQRKGA